MFRKLSLLLPGWIFLSERADNIPIYNNLVTYSQQFVSWISLKYKQLQDTTRIHNSLNIWLYTLANSAFSHTL